MSILKLNSQQMKEFASTISRRSGIALDESKSYLLQSRLKPLLKSRKLESCSALIEAINKPGNEDLIQAVIDSITTNETSFFRDQKPFTFLKEHLLKKWKDEYRQGKRKKAIIWSSACSSGQELFSIAILIREFFKGSPPFPIHFIGTDISKIVIEQAKKGIFTKYECSRGLNLQRMNSFFKKCQDGYQITPDILSHCHFSMHNLNGSWTSIPKVDLVFCRNVAIYFSPSVREKLFLRLSRQINPGGHLIIGGMESLANMKETYHKEYYQGCSYYTPV